MSVVQNPLIGRARQKLGGTVFSTWKGINVIKAKPLTVANPRTDGQVMSRQALSLWVAAGRILYSLIFFGFREQAVGKSQFNAFTGYNVKNATIKIAPGNVTVDPSAVLLAQGTVSKQPILTTVVDQSANTVAVTWSSSLLQPGQSANDICAVGVYNETSDQWAVGDGNTPRSNDSASLDLPAGFATAGQTVHVYTFFYSLTSRKSSDSVYTTTTVIA